LKKKKSQWEKFFSQVKKNFSHWNPSEKNFSSLVRKNFLTEIFFSSFFLYYFAFYTRKTPQNWKKQSVHLFSSFFLNAQIFFLLFVKIFSQVQSVEKKALEPFWNWVPSPIFSTSWTWKIIFSQQQKIFSLPKEKNKRTKYYYFQVPNVPL
jgi:hypothetical protein